MTRGKGTQCHYCPERPTTWDHIIPYSLWRKRPVRELLDPCQWPYGRLIGPWDRTSNRVGSCFACNCAKGAEWPTCQCPKCEQAGRLWAEWTVREWVGLGVELSDMALSYVTGRAVTRGSAVAVI